MSCRGEVIHAARETSILRAYQKLFSAVLLFSEGSHVL